MNHFSVRKALWGWFGSLVMVGLSACAATSVRPGSPESDTLVLVIFVVAVVLVILLSVWKARRSTPDEPFQIGSAPTLPESIPAGTHAEASSQGPTAPVPVETPPEPIQEPSEPLSPQDTQPIPVLVRAEPTPPPSFVGFTPRLTPVAPQFLEVITTEGKLVKFPLDRTRLAIGRASDNDIVIGDGFPGAASVTDYHARVELRDDWVIVEAASPDTVLFVNGQQTGRNVLHNGWRLTLGELDLTYRTAGLGTAPLSDVESEASARVPAPRPSPSIDFGLLPEGAVLMDRYIVLESRLETPTRNSYVAESLVPILNCAQCGADAGDPRQKKCQNCGASLAESVPFYPHYHIKESQNEQDLSAERQLVGLSHPNALLPRQAFAETPFGSFPRYYIVEPEAPHLAATLHVPQELTQVIEWTQDLAQGMAYLHNNGVSLGPIDLWRIALEGPQARWVDFSPCEMIAESEQAARFGQEVRALAEIAFYLITGKRRYDEAVVISPPGVGMLFDRVLGGLAAPTAAQFAQNLQAGLVEVRRPTSIDIRVGRLSDVGQVRQLNEDSLLTIEIGRVRRSISEPLGLYAVCDGMGGQAAGDVASSLAVQTLARKALNEIMSDGIVDNASPNWESWIKGTLQEANQTVFGRRRAADNDMGTTCVVALVHGDTVTLAHAGDSRCYLVNEQGIRQLTQDHSLVQRLVQLGQLTPEEARVHPRRNVIYKNLGDKPALDPDVATHKLAAGDRLVLCSDGLNSMLEDEQIRQIVLSAPSSQAACRQLVEAANRAGGEDNITVVIMQMEALD